MFFCSLGGKGCALEGSVCVCWVICQQKKEVVQTFKEERMKAKKAKKARKEKVSKEKESKETKKKESQ